MEMAHVFHRRADGQAGRQTDKAVGLAPPRLSYSIRVAVPSKRPPILGGACL